MNLKSLPLLAGTAIALSACVIIVDADDDDNDWTDHHVEDSCGTGDYDSIIGTPISAVSIPDDKLHRILRPGDMMTMDHRPERLNIDLDEDDNVTRVWCG